MNINQKFEAANIFCNCENFLGNGTIHEIPNKNWNCENLLMNIFLKYEHF